MATKEKLTARVQCTLENASDIISGVRFTPHPGTPDGETPPMVSALITDDQADAFCAIPGYERLELEPKHAKTVDEACARAAAAADAVRADSRSGGGGGVSQAEHDELVRANQQQAQELYTTRDRLAVAERQLGAVKTDAAAIARIKELEGDVARLTAEVDGLRTANAELAKKAKPGS